MKHERATVRRALICALLAVSPTGLLGQEGAFTGVGRLTPAPAGEQVVRIPVDFMATAKVAYHAPSFLLRDKAGQTNGPFRLEPGTAVPIPRHDLRIVVASPASLSLQETATGRTYGPVVPTNGALLAMGEDECRLVVQPPSIRGMLTHAKLADRTAPVSLVVARPEAVRDLVAVRARQRIIENELRLATAPVRIRAPAVTGPTGISRTPIIERSQQDVDRAKATAEHRTLAAINDYVTARRLRTTVPRPDGTFRFESLSPGFYYVCTQGVLRETDKGGHVINQPVIWWACVKLLTGEAEVVFNEENALPWNGLFPEK